MVEIFFALAEVVSYKSDLSDVLGILAEHEKRGVPITMEQIHKAASDLYGDWSSLPERSQAFIKNVMENGQFEQLYEQTLQCEQETKELLIQFGQNYPGTTTKDNMDGIAESLQEKTNRASELAKLRQMQEQADQSDQPLQRKNNNDLDR